MNKQWINSEVTENKCRQQAFFFEPLVEFQ